jgi:hypothetical protein
MRMKLEFPASQRTMSCPSAMPSELNRIPSIHYQPEAAGRRTLPRCAASAFDAVLRPGGRGTLAGKPWRVPRPLVDMFQLAPHLKEEHS